MKYFKNTIRIQISGDQVGRFLNLCSYHGICLEDIVQTEDSYCMKLSAGDFFQIKGLLRKTNTRCRILEKKGLFFRFKGQKGRLVFWMGPFLGIFLLWYLSGFLWSVQYIGNENLTEDMLNDYLLSRGVYFGMDLDRLPLAQLESDLRKEFETINWISVSLKGTCLEISLKENDVPLYEKQNPGMNLVSNVEGTVEQILIRRGTALVKPGDTVEKGTILIEGKVDIPAEDGSMKGIQFCHADGEVLIRSGITIMRTLPRQVEEKVYSGNQKQSRYLEIFGYPLSFELPTQIYENYDILDEKKSVSMFGIIPLPIQIGIRTYREFEWTRRNYDSRRGEEILTEELEKKLSALEEKGVQIIEKNVRIDTDEKSYLLQADLEVLYRINQENLYEAKQ